MPGNDIAGRIHTIFKTHLDVGFTDLARNVVLRYFKEFIPSALSTAAAMRETGSGDRFIWTTGAWLIYEYMEQAGPRDRARMEAAIAAGEITWHAMPFTLHCELMEPSLFRFGMHLSQLLDDRFGRKTIAAKMTDVPGHTRAIVPLLAEAGVEFLHIGVNEASTVPGVPPMFIWRDASGAEIVVMYHHSYGATMSVAGLPDSISFAHTTDNRGPQNLHEVLQVFSTLRAEYPRAQVVASTLNDFAVAVRAIRNSLPVVTSEIGDTWIHGVASDPRKVARFRELSRMRAGWIEADPAARDDPSVAAFSRKLLLVPEHTWGLDDKTFLADYENYSQGDFESVASSEHFAMMAESWEEQRAYIDQAMDGLADTQLATQANELLGAMEPRHPNLVGFRKVDIGSLRLATDHFTIGFDGKTGAIAALTDNQSGEVLADNEHVIGQFGYQSFSHHDYDRFLGQYITGTHDWTKPDFGKPGLENIDIESRWFEPRVSESWYAEDRSGHSVVIRLCLPAEGRGAYGAPAEILVSIHLPTAVAQISFDVQWFEKPESRLPQAGWFSFVPREGSRAEWWMQKLGTLISPSDVVSNGNRRFHAIGDYLLRKDETLILRIETRDAPLVAFGEPALLDFSNDEPVMERGVHFNLYNNVWGTNFPSWYGGNDRFRFVLKVQSKTPS